MKMCSGLHLPRNPIAIYLAKLGGEKCTHLFTLSKPIGAVEDLMCLDLGFGHADPTFKDVEILISGPSSIFLNNLCCISV